MRRRAGRCSGWQLAVLETKGEISTPVSGMCSLFTAPVEKGECPFLCKKMTKETHTPDLDDMCPFYLKHRLGQLCNSQGQRPPGVLPALLASVWRLVAIQHPAFTAHTRGPLTAPVIFTMDAGKLGGQARWTAGGRPPGRPAAACAGTRPRARAGGSGRGAGPHDGRLSRRALRV